MATNGVGGSGVGKGGSSGRHSHKEGGDSRFKRILKMAKQKNIDDYTLGKTLGEGRYGKVKMGFNRITQKKVAIKILTKANIKNEEDLTRIQRETKILTALHHENIIQVYDILETQHQIFIIMEFAEGGDLYSYLVTKRATALPIEEALVFFRQLVSAMMYCHSRFVVHRDLKPENILLDREMRNVKIADFGFSRTFLPENDNLQTSCGSLYYAAPEILEGKKYVGPEVDVWSLGVILYVLLTGEMPFEGANDHELARNIKKGVVRSGPIIASDPVYGTQLYQLVMSMLVVNPNKRAKLSAIQLHPSTWLDRPLLASLILPIARKVSIAHKPLQPASQPVIQNLKSSRDGSTTPPLKRSFSAELGPSPYPRRANPPPTSSTVPSNQPMRRQSSGSALFRTSQTNFPTTSGSPAPEENSSASPSGSSSVYTSIPTGGFSLPPEINITQSDESNLFKEDNTVIINQPQEAPEAPHPHRRRTVDYSAQTEGQSRIEKGQKEFVDKLKDFIPEFIRKRSPTQ